MSTSERRETYLTIPPDGLRRALAARALSAADLAYKASISPSTVSRILNGNRVLARVARDIMRVLDENKPFASAEEIGLVA